MIFEVNYQHTSQAILQRAEETHDYAEVCPVAQAISELFGTPTFVNTIYIEAGKLVFVPSMKLDQMIVDYDSGARFQEGVYEAELVSIHG